VNARRRVHERLRAKAQRQTRRLHALHAFNRWYYAPTRVLREIDERPHRTICGDPFCPDPLCQVFP